MELYRRSPPPFLKPLLFENFIQGLQRKGETMALKYRTELRKWRIISPPDATCVTIGCKEKPSYVAIAVGGTTSVPCCWKMKCQELALKKAIELEEQKQGKK
ncbi:MAG: hypothetical protein HY001_03095 [Candidatus Portnoybacteria bacterium]|nr:hypothetical protein [Candidatus Portnoybacteria bacterium]